MSCLCKISTGFRAQPAPGTAKQGIEKAQAAGKYRGRKIDHERYNAINRLLAISTQCAVPEVEANKSVAIILWVHVENGSKFTRSKKAVREKIAWMLLTNYQGQKLNDTETRIMIQFADDADLKEQIDEIPGEIYQIADFRNCEITDLSLQEESTDRYQDDCDGGWKQVRIPMKSAIDSTTTPATF